MTPPIRTVSSPAAHQDETIILGWPDGMGLAIFR
jgi:hypothetical protein